MVSLYMRKELCQSVRMRLRECVCESIEERYEIVYLICAPLLWIDKYKESDDRYC